MTDIVRVWGTCDNIKIEFDENRGFKDNGLDKVEFLFASNYGEELKPLSKIASGGEMSRIMLAIKKVLSEADEIINLGGRERKMKQYLADAEYELNVETEALKHLEKSF